MMNEWGIPPVELHSLLHEYVMELSKKKKYVPPLAVGSGFTFEDGIFKALALGAPFVKLVGMARGPIAAAMVGKTIGRTIENHQVPVYIERFGRSKDEIFVTASSLRKELGDEAFEKVPTGALGLYTYYERLAQGLRQFMAGSRKFSLEHMSRNDITALTREAAEISGIPYIMDLDRAEAKKILNGQRNGSGARKKMPLKNSAGGKRSGLRSV
jgi:glutamate synthase domain-containing protein 2